MTSVQANEIILTDRAQQVFEAMTLGYGVWETTYEIAGRAFWRSPRMRLVQTAAILNYLARVGLVAKRVERPRGYAEWSMTEAGIARAEGRAI